MLKSTPSYKTRGVSHAATLSSPNKKDESATQNYAIFGVIGVGLLLIILLYLTFGGSAFRGQQIVIGTEHFAQLNPERSNIPIYDKYAMVMGQKIFYRECLPLQEVYNTVDLLFLHGQKYSSVTWKGLGTLQIFASFGYKSVAIDLPGHGFSKNNVQIYSEDIQRINFIESFINNIGLRKVVIIAPSKSGDYAMPVLMSSIGNGGNLGRSLDFELNGFVAIAPTGVEKYNKLDYQKVDVPVLIMWGERDRTDWKENAKFSILYLMRFVFFCFVKLALFDCDWSVFVCYCVKKSSQEKHKNNRKNEV